MADIKLGNKTYAGVKAIKLNTTDGDAHIFPTLQERKVVPSTIEQNISPDNGYDGFSIIRVPGDSNLIPENIKSGVSIFGVAGQHDSVYSPNGLIITPMAKGIPGMVGHANMEYELVGLELTSTATEG